MKLIPVLDWLLLGDCLNNNKWDNFLLLKIFETNDFKSLPDVLYVTKLDESVYIYFNLLFDIIVHELNTISKLKHVIM